MNAFRIIRGGALPLLLFVLFSAAKKAPEPRVDLAELDFRNGDIVFQHLPGKLGSVICDVTDSQLSHCGLVVTHNGELHVLEAIGPVRYLPLKRWLKQGDRARFTQMRLKDATAEQIADSVKAAERLLGRPYDLLYELDDAKIYCSELVYKAYLRGAGFEIGQRQALSELNWKPHEKFIRLLTGGELPLDRVLVTPESVASSPQLKLIYSTFPAREDEAFFDQTVLAGHWSGEYTIKDLTPASASLEFGRSGSFSSGQIRPADGTQIEIREVRVEPFNSKREFSARLRDSRGISATLHARIRDSGRRIIGDWHDDLGNRGVFSLEKQPGERGT